MGSNASQSHHHFAPFEDDLSAPELEGSSAKKPAGSEVRIAFVLLLIFALLLHPPPRATVSRLSSVFVCPSKLKNGVEWMHHRHDDAEQIEYCK
jgi:hypothetical protein